MQSKRVGHRTCGVSVERWRNYYIRRRDFWQGGGKKVAEVLTLWCKSIGRHRTKVRGGGSQRTVCTREHPFSILMFTNHIAFKIKYWENNVRHREGLIRGAGSLVESHPPCVDLTIAIGSDSLGPDDQRRLNISTASVLHIGVVLNTIFNMMHCKSSRAKRRCKGLRSR